MDFGIRGGPGTTPPWMSRMTLSGLQTEFAKVSRRALIQEQQFKQPCLCYESTCAYTCSRAHTQTPFLCTRAHTHTHTILLHMCIHTQPILLHTHTILLCTRTPFFCAHTHTPFFCTYTHTPFFCTYKPFLCMLTHTHTILLNRFPIGHISAIFCYCLLFVEMSLN